MASDPPFITAALNYRRTGRVWSLLKKGADINVTDAGGHTALARVAMDALKRRIPHWVHHDMDYSRGIPVSFTITNGVMVHRKGNRVMKMSFRAQWQFARQYCPAFHRYLRVIQRCCVLLNEGASLTARDREGRTVRQRLEAVAHPEIERAMADQPAVLAKARRYAEQKARSEARWAARQRAQAKRLKKMIAKNRAAEKARKLAKLAKKAAQARKYRQAKKAKAKKA